MRSLTTDKLYYLGNQISVGSITKTIVGFGSVLLEKTTVRITIPITYTISGIDAQILGQLFTMAGTKIIANNTLSASNFYDVNGYSWIQYKQGPTGVSGEDDFMAGIKDISAARNIKSDILSSLHISDGTTYDATRQGTANLDCSAVFLNQSSKWYNFHNLQDFILSYFANKLLGHPGALAAISNDSEIRSNVTTGFTSSLNELQTMTEDKLKSIVQQMMNQDLARFSEDAKDGSPSSMTGGVITPASSYASTTQNVIGDNDSYLLVFTLA